MDKKESSELEPEVEEERTDISSLVPSGDASDLRGGVLSLSSVLEDQLQQGDRRSSGQNQTQEPDIFTDETDLGLIPSHKSLVMSEGKKTVIGPDGGKIEVGGCAVTFCAGCFLQDTNVYTKAEIDSSKWPPNFTCITAMFWVECQRLMTGASFRMSSWCIGSRSRVQVSVLHQSYANEPWHVVATMLLHDEKEFCFDCHAFSPYVIGILDDEVSTTNFVIKSHVYAGRGNFTLAFFLQHELMEKAIQREMAKRGLELHLNLAPIPVKMNDNISGNLRCMNKSFQFANECKKVFEIDTEFARLRKQAIFCTSVLIGSGEPNLPLLFEYEVQKNEILVEEPQFFSWIPEKQVMQHQGQGTLKLTADITQDYTIKHLPFGGMSIGTGNTHEKQQQQIADTFPPAHGAVESTKGQRSSKKVNKSVSEPSQIRAQMAPVGGHEDRLTASESKNVMIGPDGGTVEVGGCAIIFPSGCFDDFSKIFAKAEIDSSKWPPNYICIAAMLWVKSHEKLLCRASIKMKSWCIKERGASDKTEAHILHQRKNSLTWDVIGTLALNEQKIFQFDCTDFCAYILGIPESEFPLAKLVIDGYIYADKANNFTLAFFLQHQLILKFIEEQMAKLKREQKLIFNTRKVEIDDQITAYLDCTNDNFRFPEEFRESLKIDSNFVKLERKTFFHSHLDGKSNRTQSVSFKCGIHKNGTSADGPHTFCCEWTPIFKDQNEQQATMETEDKTPDKTEVIHHHNKYEAAKMFFDGRNNKYDQRQHPGSGFIDGRLLLLLSLAVFLVAWAWTISH